MADGPTPASRGINRGPLPSVIDPIKEASRWRLYGALPQIPEHPNILIFLTLVACSMSRILRGDRPHLVNHENTAWDQWIWNHREKIIYFLF